MHCGFDPEETEDPEEHVHICVPIYYTYMNYMYN